MDSLLVEAQAVLKDLLGSEATLRRPHTLPLHAGDRMVVASTESGLAVRVEDDSGAALSLSGTLPEGLVLEISGETLALSEEVGVEGGEGVLVVETDLSFEVGEEVSLSPAAFDAFEATDFDSTSTVGDMPTSHKYVSLWWEEGQLRPREGDLLEVRGEDWVIAEAAGEPPLIECRVTKGGR